MAQLNKPAVYSEDVPGGMAVAGSTASPLADDGRPVRSIYIQVPTGQNTVEWGYISRASGAFTTHGLILAGGATTITASSLTPATIQIRSSSGATVYWSSVQA